MALYHYKRIVRDSDGDVVPSVTVEVNQASSETNQAIYSDSAGTVKSNPFTSDSDGIYEFWVDEGATIDIDFTKSGFSIDSLNGITIPLISSGGVDHGSVAGLADDDHAQYALLAGRSGGQTINLGADSGDGGEVHSTPDATKGTINFGDTLYVNESNNRVGIGQSNPAQPLHLEGSGAIVALIRSTAGSPSVADFQLRNSGNYWRWTVNTNRGSEMALNDVTGGGFPFAVATGAPTNSLAIDSSGQVGIGTSPDAAAALEVSSTTAGVLFPRMTTTQRDAISSPPDGLVIYNTSLSKLQVRAGGAWVSLH